MEALEAVSLWPTKDYIRRRQDTIAEYIVNHTIYELIKGAEQMPGSSRLLWWRDKDLNREEEGNTTSEGLETELG